MISFLARWKWTTLAVILLAGFIAWNISDPPPLPKYLAIAGSSLLAVLDARRPRRNRSHARSVPPQEPRRDLPHLPCPPQCRIRVAHSHTDPGLL